MVRRRRQTYFSRRNCFLFTISIAIILVLLYEVMVYCMLDKLSTSGIVQGAMVRYQGETRAITLIHSHKVLHEFSGFRPPDLTELETNKVLNTVHYVWCTNSTFTFKNYLSILSVWKIIQPDIIEFHEKGGACAQTDKYNDWLDKIQRTIPSFVRKPLPRNWDGDDHGCGFWFGLAVLDDRGGIYIGTDVIVTDALLGNKRNNLTLMFYRSSPSYKYEVAAAMATDHQKSFRSFRRNFDGDKDIDFNKVQKPCAKYSKGANISGVECFVVENELHPVDLFTDDSQSGAFLRKLMYGTSQIIEAKPALPGFIPKIVHYVWFGGKEMSFMMYLSMLSTLYILDPTRVYVHGDGGLYGQYVDRIKRDDRVVFVQREKPYHIFGHNILYSQHRSDIVRAECLLKYGGIYMDWDVLWLRDPVDVISKGHDAVANFDHMDQPGFPETINLGVLMAKPRSTFIKRWQDALAGYRSKDFLYNAVELPYKIYEEYPEYLHIERRLQVMCFHLKCHPTFHPKFKSFMEEQPFDWRKDVYAIHYTYPDPPEFDTPLALQNRSGVAADIGNFILAHSHKLDASVD